MRSGGEASGSGVRPADRTAPAASLGRRVGRGAGWSVGARLLARTSGFLATLVLARLLSPEAFGVVGLALLANGLTEAFSQVGLRQYLIQRQERVRPLLGAAWTFIILRSALISLLLITAAPWLAAAVAMPEATGILRVMGLIPLIRGLQNIEFVVWMKRLEFHKQFVLDAMPQLGLLVVGVGLALVWRSPWALALGYLAGAILQTTASFLLAEAPPRPRWSLRRGRLMLRFGVLAFLGMLVGYLTLRGGEWAVAWLFDSAALGLYVLAFTICNVPSGDLVKPLGRVLFPTFALLRGHAERLESVFCRSYAVLIALTAPFALGLVLVAPDFAAAVLGPSWSGITPLLQLVGIGALFRILSTGGLGIPYALSRPDVPVTEGVVGGLALMVAIGIYLYVVPAPERSVVGVAACATGAQIVQSLVRLLMHLELLDVRWRRLVAAVVPTLVALAGMTLAVWVVQMALAPGFLRLALTVAAGVLTYLAGLAVFWRVGGRGPIADLVSARYARPASRDDDAGAASVERVS